MRKTRPRAASSRGCSADGAAGRAAGGRVCPVGPARGGTGALVRSASGAVAALAMADGVGGRAVLPDGADGAARLCALCGPRDAAALCAFGRRVGAARLFFNGEPLGAARVFRAGGGAWQIGLAVALARADCAEIFSDFFQKTLCKSQKMGYNNRQGMRAAACRRAGKEGQKA